MFKINNLSAYISIHAPMQERQENGGETVMAGNFNPRSYVGATCLYFASYMRIGFQSTLLCRSDSCCHICQICTWRFQSTLLCRSDFYFEKLKEQNNDISIHAPMQERRHSTLPKRQSWRFQSTLLCRSDGFVVWDDVTQPSFQSTLLCRSDIRLCLRLPKPDYFNPRSYVGATAII